MNPIPNPLLRRTGLSLCRSKHVTGKVRLYSSGTCSALTAILLFSLAAVRADFWAQGDCLQYITCCRTLSGDSLSHVLCLLFPQKTAVAVAHCKTGNGSIKLNGASHCQLQLLRRICSVSISLGGSSGGLLVN